MKPNVSIVKLIMDEEPIMREAGAIQGERGATGPLRRVSEHHRSRQSPVNQLIQLIFVHHPPCTTSLLLVQFSWNYY